MRFFLSGLFFMAAIFFSACSQKNSDVPENAIDPDAMNNPATASNDTKAGSRLPVFVFETETHDFGSIPEGENISFGFKFKNSGKSDLVISSATGSCGCTVADWPKDPIAPGKEEVVKVTFNSAGKTGMQHKTITLVANTIPNSKVLTISGEVKKKDE